ncbi:hypothetical protein PVAP13_9NG521814 [Panicum virgatum]|uniref:Uncharacterized protein n=1 Tax=Panicum virgatum TaxID=38727 RepID=A0A8T0MRT5_PANVG|nr:hypothetical protein PVAP13_9NG521814 [Panicum virgatum]
MGSSCSLGSSCRRRAPCRVSSRSSRLRRRGEGASAWGPWRSTTASASSLGPRRRRGSSRPSETVAIQQRQAATGCQARGRTKQSQGEEREHEPGEGRQPSEQEHTWPEAKHARCVGQQLAR